MTVFEKRLSWLRYYAGEDGESQVTTGRDEIHANKITVKLLKKKCTLSKIIIMIITIIIIQFLIYIVHL